MAADPSRADGSSAPGTTAAAGFRCRFCDAALEHSMVDLGLSPLCEDFIRPEELRTPERYYPLEAFVCTRCWLVQVDEFAGNDEIFDADYGYFSSFSTSWLRHAARYVEMACERFALGPEAFVVEIASNDGYLLRNFVERGVPCLGIDPSGNVAAAAREAGVDTRVDFFTEALAREVLASRGPADLVVANNVLAHTPRLMDFVRGIAALVAPEGRATFEFPHLLNLIEQVQFDTIYHEHFSYFSLHTVREIFRSVGMEIVDVEELPTHGGSLRLFVEHAAKGTAPSDAIARVLAAEADAGLRELSTYLEFGARAARVKDELLKLLIRLKEEGARVAGYGAPGKGNTLLNYCGIKPDLLPYTCDMSVHKHGRHTPGSRIPIFPPSRIDEERPDYIVILPWNLAKEITAQLAHAREWGARFVVPVPTATVLD